MPLDSHIRHTTAANDRVLAALHGIRNGYPKIEYQFNTPVHPFPARMPLSIAFALIEALSKPGDVILDPMAGSGTTVIAAKYLGRIGIGVDLDPLSVRLARAATVSVDTECLQRAQEHVHARAKALARKKLTHLRRQVAELDGEETDFLDYWFPERSQRELLALSLAISHVRDGTARMFLWSVFSSLIIAKSDGASYALDLAHSRPHRDRDKVVTPPLNRWARQFKRMIGRLQFKTGHDNGGHAEVYLGDARQLPLRDSTVDLIVTSPPYLHAIDYIRAHKFALVLMGHSLSELREIRGRLIGTERGIRDRDGLPEALVQRLERVIPDSPRQARVRRYLLDLQAALLECSRVLRPGGLSIMALGPLIISRRRTDALKVVEALAVEAGLSAVGSVARRLDESRRALPPPRKVGKKNSLRKRMEGEVYLALRKLEAQGRGRIS